MKKKFYITPTVEQSIYFTLGTLCTSTKPGDDDYQPNPGMAPGRRGIFL